MEPIIYKPSIYKGAGIYKAGSQGGGAGVYNGAGVYKSKSKPNKIELGGKIYPLVEINGLLWTVYNLDFIFDNLNVGDHFLPNSSAAWYYNNDENNYGWNGRKYGLLYNFYAVQELESLLPPCFRLPTNDEWNSLRNFVNNNSTSLKEKNLSYAPNWGGDNTLGLSILPSGARLGTGFYNSPNYGHYWSGTEYSSDRAFIRTFIENGDMPDGNNIFTDALTVRLVCPI